MRKIIFVCFFEFSVFIVRVLNVKKCIQVIENCIQGNLLSFDTDTLKKNMKFKKAKIFNFSLFFLI